MKPKDAYRWAVCNDCSDRSECDMKQPCDSCFNKGQDCLRDGSVKGTFARGVPGDNLRGYYYRLGRPIVPDWIQPDNYHLELAHEVARVKNWAWNGPDPTDPNLPPQGPIYVGDHPQELSGVAVPPTQPPAPVQNQRQGQVPQAMNVPAPNVPLAPFGQVALNPIVPVAPRALVGPERRQAYWNQNVSDSPVVRSTPESEAIYNAFSGVLGAPVIGPISSVTEHPIARPPSPGPSWFIYTNQRVALADHPRSVGGVPLANIPLQPIPPAAGGQAVGPLPCPEVTPNTHGFVCEALTQRVCEHTSHHPAVPVVICEPHDIASRWRIQDIFKSYDIAQKMRRFACEACCQMYDVNASQVLAGQGWRVYDGRERTDYDPTAMNNNQEVCGGLYKPMPITGCSCATKLIDRALCSAHRFEGLVTLWERRDAIEQFAARTGVPNVCFSCGQRESINVGPAPNLCKGAIGKPKAWMCAVCEGVVISVLPDDGYAWVGGNLGFSASINN